LLLSFSLKISGGCPPHLALERITAGRHQFFDEVLLLLLLLLLLPLQLSQVAKSAEEEAEVASTSLFGSGPGPKRTPRAVSKEAKVRSCPRPYGPKRSCS
jgi:hypothetical protein